MTETMSVDSAIKLIRAGVFVDGQLAGVNEQGAAIYCGPARTPIVRPTGPRPGGVKPYRGLMGTLVDDPADDTPKRRRTRGGV